MDDQFVPVAKTPGNHYKKLQDTGLPEISSEFIFSLVRSWYTGRYDKCDSSFTAKISHGEDFPYICRHNEHVHGYS